MFESWDDVKEFTWIGVQVAIVCAVIAGVLAIGIFIVVLIFNAIIHNKPVQPPAMNAPLLEIVRYCEPLARDTTSKTTVMPVLVGKVITVVPRTMTETRDNADKFIACMQGYEYTVER